MSSEHEELPLFNFEKIYHIVSSFRLPLILASLGTLLVIISLYMINAQNNKEAEIKFSTEASSSGSYSGKIHVDIEGAVNNSGVYQFNTDERVAAAITRAGGLSTTADLDWIEKNINKAAKLIDGGKIYFPEKSETAGKTINERTNEKQEVLVLASGLVNINSATQGELESLPGVGPATAVKIIGGRPYQTIEELKSKKIVGNALYDKIKDKINI